MQPTLKAPRTERLKLKSDEPLSNFDFKFNLRRYIMALAKEQAVKSRKRLVGGDGEEGELEDIAAEGLRGEDL